MKKFLAISLLLFAQGDSLQANYKVAGVTKGQVNTLNKAFYNRECLKAFDCKIQKIRKYTAPTGDVLTLLVIGDSWSYTAIQGPTAATWTDRAIFELWKRFGAAGDGFLPANDAYQQTRSYSSRAANVGTWSGQSLGYELFPVSGAFCGSTTNATITFTAIGTDYAVHYLKKPNGGKFTVKVGSGAESAEIDTGNATTEYAVLDKTTLAALGSLTDASRSIVIKVTTVATNGVSIVGLDVIRNKADQFGGIRLHNVSVGGQSSADYAAINATAFNTAVTALAPDVAIIMLGVNDASSLSPATYIANIQTICTRIRAARPGCDILLMCPAQAAPSTYSIGDYAVLLREYALANQFGFIDWTVALESYANDLVRWGSNTLWASTAHLSTAGYRLLADSLVYNYLISGVGNSYVSSSGTSENYFAGVGMPPSITTGIANVCVGPYAGDAITTAQANAFFGFGAGSYTSIGGNNCGFGYNSIAAGWPIGSSAFGHSSLAAGGGNYNSAFGRYAGGRLSTGDTNVFLGNYAGGRQTGVSNKLFIDALDRSTAGAELTSALVVGTFSATPADQVFNINGSLQITGTQLISSAGYITPITSTDAAAPVNSIYYSSTQSKLVYKDSGGSVNVLY
jgi:lysophospholipase L1-like esterase